MNNKQHNHIIEQVPVDYYQVGVEKNILQHIWHTNKVNVLLDFISNSPRKILDVGCASGWLISKIAACYPKARCYGIDIYTNAISYARTLYPAISFRVADAHKLPFKDESFDLVICTEVLEHVDDPKGVLLEMKRVLKKDGQAIVELDSGSILFSAVWYLWRKRNGKVWNDSHLHSFNVRKLKQLSKICGFTILKEKRFSFGMAMVFLLKK